MNKKLGICLLLIFVLLGWLALMVDTIEGRVSRLEQWEAPTTHSLPVTVIIKDERPEFVPAELITAPISVIERIEE